MDPESTEEYLNIEPEDGKSTIRLKISMQAAYTLKKRNTSGGANVTRDLIVEQLWHLMEHVALLGDSMTEFELMQEPESKRLENIERDLK